MGRIRKDLVMCSSIQEKDKQIKEFVFATLLAEILKDGEVDQAERETIQSLSPVLDIPKQRAIEIRNEVLSNLEKSADSGSASFENLFATVRTKLLEKHPAVATDEYLEKLAEKMGRHTEFMDSLSAGF